MSDQGSEAEDTPAAPGEGGLSLWRLFRRFRLRIILTWLLVIGDSSLMLLFPLIIGIAIDDYLEGSFSGLSMLVGLGLLSLLVGAGRRFYDTRIYPISRRRISRSAGASSSLCWPTR